MVVAQQVATLEQLAPGRAFVGVGSSEAMNEIPCGIEWPGIGEQQRRTEEALTIITRLLDGERVDFEGEYFSARGARLEGAREWKATLVDEHYTEPIHEPGDIGRNGREVSDTQFKAMGILSSDPATHVKKIKAMQQMGATAVVLMNVSGADPLGTLRTYGEHVLPELRQA